MAKKGKYMAILLILLFAAAAVTASIALPALIKEEESLPQPELTTRFYVINESEMLSGEPAFYRVVLENREGKTVDYELKIRFTGEVIYSREIRLNNSETLNQTIPLILNQTGDYAKLEFLLYKGNESYRISVFQIPPAVDSHNISKVSNATLPKILNSDMEKDIFWEFKGNGFTGNYTTYEWSSPNRSYQIKASKGVKKDAFGSIQQNFSSEKEVYASVSFDVKSDNASYYLQALVNDKVVWENYSGKGWQRIRVPVALKRSNKITLKVTAKNDTKSGITSWWDNVVLEANSPAKIESTKEEVETVETYDKQQRGNTTIYTFNTGEKLELNILKGNVDKWSGLYTTNATGNNITFLGEAYERVLPDRVNYLYPVIVGMRDIKLKVNETLQLKSGYAVTVKRMDDNQGFKLSISKNNRTVREIIISGISRIEYWKDIDDYKKQKVIQMNLTKIYQDEFIFDIIQYGNRKIITSGSKYGEFQVTNITSDTIVMENIQPIKIEPGKVLSLMNGKIKIKV